MAAAIHHLPLLFRVVSLPREREQKYTHNELYLLPNRVLLRQK